MSEPSRPVIVDLFCGSGGMSEGFRQAGFDIRGGFDYSKPAMATWSARFGEEHAERIKLQKLTGKLLDSWKERIGKVDVVIGGPSCQGYSTSGGLSKKRGRDLYDPRNSLFTEYVRLVRELKPDWLVFENVPGLLLYERGAVARVIYEMFQPDYVVRPLILLAADYGVPQLRRRLIFIGTRMGTPIRFPAPTHGDPDLWKGFALPFQHLSRVGHGSAGEPHLSFADATNDLPPLAEGERLDQTPYSSPPANSYQADLRRNSPLVQQHYASNLCESDRYAAQNLEPGQNWRHIPDDVRPARFNRIKPYDATTLMKRLLPDRPSYTITTKFNEASTGAFIHPHQPRTLSLREAARLQSFPDDFVFSGSDAQIRMQIGNAVPPLLAKALAEAILPDILTARTGVQVEPIRDTIDLKEADLGDIIGLTSARKKTKDYRQQRLPLPGVS